MFMEKSYYKILDEIESAGFVAYIVGGYVRDKILGVITADIDIITNATPKDLNGIFKNIKKTYLDYGAVKLYIDNHIIDITTFRREFDYKNNKPSRIEYISSLETVKSMLNTHKSINIAIDLHRDGRDLKTDADIQKEHERMSTTYKGEKVAKFFFVVGMRNPNVNEVKSLAEDITKFAKTKYPELVLSVVEKPVGKFNQYMAQNHMLIEVGSNGTSSEEAKASAKYIAEILDEYFKQNR